MAFAMFIAKASALNFVALSASVVTSVMRASLQLHFNFVTARESTLHANFGIGALGYRLSKNCCCTATFVLALSYWGPRRPISCLGFNDFGRQWFGVPDFIWQNC